MGVFISPWLLGLPINENKGCLGVPLFVDNDSFSDETSSRSAAKAVFFLNDVHKEHWSTPLR